MSPDDQPVNSLRDAKTLGEYRVGIDFNPGGNDAVSELKVLVAHFIDRVDELTGGSQNPEVKRLAALAMTHAEDAAMWAVKAVTKPDRQ